MNITTTGQRTGQPRTIEIVIHNIDGRLIVSGMLRADRKRSWLLDLESNPHLTFRLKGAVTADLPTTARKITDQAEGHAVVEWITANAWHKQDLDAMTG